MSKIPPDWTIKRLDELSERVKRKNSTGCPITLTISAEFGLVDQITFFNKKVSSANTEHYTLLQKGEFAYNKSYSTGYPVGVVRRLDLYEEGALSPLYICFKLNNIANHKFIEYFFETQWFIDEIMYIAKEGARNHGLLNVSIGDFFNISMLLPPLAEQQRIADILTSVDEAIQAREAVLEQTKVVKKGLLQDLLTKGIGHTEFKDSKLGPIPVTWGVDTLENVLDKLIDYRGKPPPKSESGIPLITARNIRFGFINPEPREYIPEDRWDDWMSRGNLEHNDILFTMEAPLGNAAKLPKYKCAIAQRTVAFRVNEDIYNSDFLLQTILGDNFQKRIAKRATGSTALGIKQKTIRKILLPLPPLAEQQQIADILTSVDDQIQAHESAIEQLKQTKTGLLQDLLTGKVRVEVAA